MNKLKREDGVAHLFLLLLVVVALIAGAGYYVWVKQGEDKSDAVFTPAPSEPCEGKWYDTHAHLDEDELSRDLADKMRQYKVGCSLMFVEVDIDDPEISLLELREEFAPNPGRFVLFGDVIDQPGLVTRQKLDKVKQVFGDKLIGLGEFAFYNPPFKGTSLESEPWPTVFDFAADNDLFVMLHVTQNDSAALERMLSKYPDTKVLLHHNELSQELSGLLKKHENLHYTLDTTNLTSIKRDDSIAGAFYETTFFPPKSNSAKDFLGLLNSNRKTLLEQTAKDWQGVFEAAPDRVMWGTDVALDWHIDDSVYSALMEFSDAFVSRLPEQYRDKYMKQNALKHFGAGVVLEDLTESEYDKLDSSDNDEDDDDASD